MFRFFLVFWSSTSSAATRYGLQTTEPKVPICIICCRHARIRTRADSHDGCTHVIRLKVDRKNTPLQKYKSLSLKIQRIKKSEVFIITFGYLWKRYYLRKKVASLHCSILNKLYIYYINCYIKIINCCRKARSLPLLEI